MIIVTLKGGLGNQLFQYAMGRRLSARRRTRLLLDTSYYRQHRCNHQVTQRHMGLAFFRLNELIKIGDYKLRRQTRSRIGRALIESITKPPKYVCEKNLSFDPANLTLPDNTCIDGYWQSEKYFMDIRAELLLELQPRFTLSSEAKAILSKIRSYNKPVSLHVRRGDFVNREDYRRTFGVMTPRYYRDAMIKLAANRKGVHVFVFSDDVEWCKSNLNIEFGYTWVEINNDAEELMLMAACKHNVIANSSFSWWGAWLNQDPEQIVVAPRQWFIDPIANSQVASLVPERWITI